MTAISNVVYYIVAAVIGFVLLTHFYNTYKEWQETRRKHQKPVEEKKI